MTKNNTKQNPSNDGEFLDSQNSLESTESNKINLENSQEQKSITNTEELTITKEENNNDVVLDKTFTTEPKIIEIPLTISKSISNTSSKNTTSTKKYKVLLSTPTKYILDLEERGGASYNHTSYTLSQNYISGVTEIEEPVPEEGN